ncbi:MAG: pantoate--beta-alanine ligase [Alphaproteobacteria bacterium]|nr:pantoate--beta-alanine ligase [Alphaproteobacteria bacterium]
MATLKDNAHLPVFHSKEAIRSIVANWRESGRTIALAPTMGALHDGHLSLVEKGRRVCDRVVASIFVNPKQFAPHEDLATYPRTFEDDLRLLAAAACDGVYAPDAAQMYPDGFQTSVAVNALAAPLCGESRPHFFGGVATVVCKLLLQVRPDVAVFGEKDYQQLLVIRRMVADLDIDVEIVGAPIVRHTDGLAMSSRNAYLTPENRARAVIIPATLAETAEVIGAGSRPSAAIAAARARIEAAGVDRIDYIEARRADDLAPLVDGDDAPARVFAAVVIGGTRLIDNWAVPRNGNP